MMTFDRSSKDKITISATRWHFYFTAAFFAFFYGAALPAFFFLYKHGSYGSLVDMIFYGLMTVGVALVVLFVSFKPVNFQEHRVSQL